MRRHALALMMVIVSSLAARSALADASAGDDAGYLRVVDVDDRTVRLDVAVRLFVPEEGDGPTVALAGAIHMAQPEFYALLQQFLDAQDLVLYEGVKPRGMAAGEPLDEPGRVRKTEAAIRFVAIALARYEAEKDEYPPTLEALAAWMREVEPTHAVFLDASLTDAWGNPLIYEPGEGDFELSSLGADGEPGGEGPAADLSFADQKPLTALETGEKAGIQATLAGSMGLVFQLDAMNMARPHFRNSDLTIDQIERMIAQRGGDASQLMDMLDGSSWTTKILEFALKLVERNPQAQATMRVMIIEVLRLAEGGLEGLMRQAPEGTAEMFSVIIGDRNAVVIEDLRAALSGDGEPTSVAIVYGAGHMADLEARLVEELGYREVGVFWLPAIEADLSEAGMTRLELGFIRKMLDRMGR